jgi:AraC-like DNA-binding protein
LLQNILQQNNFVVQAIGFGFVEIELTKEKTEDEFLQVLKTENFEILQDKDKIKVEQIKQAVIELIHYMNNVDSIIRKSEYLIEKMQMSYQQISRLFSKYEDITLEKFIILHKIEKVKQLLENEDYTLSEISFMMDYSSVQHLSNQFKKITGYTVSEYKELKNKPKTPIENIGK